MSLKFVLVVVLSIVLAASAFPASPKMEKNYEIDEKLFEGDILGVNPTKGAAIFQTSRVRFWPRGVVPYVIGKEYSESDVQKILDGMKEIEDKTRVGDKDCIKFVPRINEVPYLRVYNGSGCSSYVGRQLSMTDQVVSIRSPGCTSLGTVSHEFLHALGFFHEQSRPDRDDFVTIQYENIQEGTERNFNKYGYEDIDLLGLPYDYSSVMHYSATAFSKNGQPTIVPKQEGAPIGQRGGLSDQDVEEVRRLYHCVC